MLATALQLDARASLSRPLMLRAALGCGALDVIARHGPIRPDAIARRVSLGRGATQAVVRCLRFCALVAETPDGLVLSEAAHDLTRPDIARAYPLLPRELRAWARASDCLRGQGAQFASANGIDYWDALEESPKDSADTSAMIALSNQVVLRFLRTAVPWGRYEPLVDLGAGDASFLMGLLRYYPDMTAIAFDLPRQAELAQQRIADAEMTARCQTATGNFFDDQLPSGGSYLLKNILHDCDDSAARHLLARVRDVIPQDGRLFLVEAFPKPNNAFDIGKLLDLNSLVLVGGRDRSVAEYNALLSETGFRLNHVHETGNALSLMEAKPVPVTA
ncbi:MAG: methyltransferase [Paracoccaceae bacterium]|nr:methyltransferase [Paracoccaceae bacterium]